MKIMLLQIDKTQDAYLKEGIEIYNSRLKNYTVFDTVTINVPKTVRQRSLKEQKIEEGKLILSNISVDDFLILLDEKGKEYSSVDFAQFINQKQNASLKRIVFIIGGPFGAPGLDRGSAGSAGCDRYLLGLGTHRHRFISRPAYRVPLLGESAWGAEGRARVQ